MTRKALKGGRSVLEMIIPHCGRFFGNSGKAGENAANAASRDLTASMKVRRHKHSIHSFLYIRPKLSMEEIFIKLSLAVLFGGIIGFEREYSSKAAGFRTITMITLGATVFTILSFRIGTEQNHDHIAANIITGIGFIGAGVIFKEGLNVSGLTTASTIWVSAAMGMAIGIGEYVMASFTVLLSIIVLSLFERVQDVIESFHQVRTYRINYVNDYAGPKLKVEEQMKSLGVSFKIRKAIQTGEAVSFFYNVSGRQEKLNRLSEYLLGTIEVKSFEE